MGFVDIIVQYQKFESSIGNKEKATYIGFQLSGQTGPFLAVLKKNWGDYEQLLRAVFSCYHRQTKNLNFFFAPENMKKPPSKVAHNLPQFFFHYCQLAQNQPKSHFLSHKNVSLHDSCVMTLIQSIRQQIL